MIFSKEYLLSDKRVITEYTLTNTAGMRVEILNLGGIIKGIFVPDGAGNLENIVLNFEDINDYIKNPGYIGAVIGRVAGRIGGSEVKLGESVYQLSQNEGKNQLHGGKEGFDKKIWEVSPFEEDQCQLVLKSRSPHLEQGYPGNLEINVTYTLKEDNTLEIDYKATTDKMTVVNMTNHTYFNLSGNLKQKIDHHQISIHSDQIAMLDEELIVTGKYLSVEGTPFDLNRPCAVESGVDQNHAQLLLGKGYDHPWVLGDSDKLPQIICYDPVSGRKLEVTTNQKAVVVYAMNYPIQATMAPGIFDKDETRLGICFETQGLPIGHNFVNQQDVILNPDETYHQQTTWKFSTCSTLAK